MVLIKCSECGKEVSNLATSCPHCGKPNQGKTILIEQTSKTWKLATLIGVALTIIGFYFFFTADGFIRVLGGSFGSWGIIIIIIGQIGSFWSNR